MNGPAVGLNEGQATPESIGDVHEIAISYMETALKAQLNPAAADEIRPCPKPSEKG